MPSLLALGQPAALVGQASGGGLSRPNSSSRLSSLADSQQPQQAKHWEQPQQQQRSSNSNWIDALQTAMGPLTVAHRVVDNRVYGARVKGVSEPLGECVKARLFNSHRIGRSEGEVVVDPSSVCLAAMVHEFMEEDVEVPLNMQHACNCNNVEGVSCTSDCSAEMGDPTELSHVLKSLAKSTTALERALHANVMAAMRAAKEQIVNPLTSDSDSEDEMTGKLLRRDVMTKLRSMGYNAGVCTSRWDHSRGFPGGEYSYIDVQMESSQSSRSERIIVDIEFRAQFEIARPTQQYTMAMASLPEVFVGRPEQLQQLVDMMSDATKTSLKKRGMHVPPWRRPEYMRARWFSSFKRSTSAEPEPMSPTGSAEGSPMASGSSMAWVAVAVPVDREQKGVDIEIEGREVAAELLAKAGGQKVQWRHPELISGKENESVPLQWSPPVVERKKTAQPGSSGLSKVLMESGLTAAMKEHTRQQEQQTKQKLSALKKGVVGKPVRPRMAYAAS